MDLANTSVDLWICLRDDSLLQLVWDMMLNYRDYLQSPLFPIVLCLPTLSCAFPFLFATSWEKGGHGSSNSRSNLAVVPQPLHCCTMQVSPCTTTCFLCSQHQWPSGHGGHLWTCRTGHLLELIAGVISNLLLFNFQYFIWHLLHHRIRWLYVTFHAIHHNYSSPFALATQCLGGWELVTVGFWTTLNPMVLRCHQLTTWAFMVLHVYVSIEDHCGYDFPWSTSRLIPFGIYGGPSKHDVHHQKPNTNFAPHFTHWDKNVGTHADFSFSAMK